MKKVVMPPGAVSLDDVDLDQVSVDFVLNCAKKDPESPGSPPRREPPIAPIIMPSHIFPSLATLENFVSAEAEESSSLSKSQSLSSTQVQELTVDDIFEFDDDDALEEVDSGRYSRRVLNDAADLALRLPYFTTVLLASAGASGVPVKEKKKDKKSRLLRNMLRLQLSIPLVWLVFWRLHVQMQEQKYRL